MFFVFCKDAVTNCVMSMGSYLSFFVRVKKQLVTLCYVNGQLAIVLYEWAVIDRFKSRGSFTDCPSVTLSFLPRGALPVRQEQHY